MPTTSRGYRYPASSAAPNVPLDMGNLASDIDADVAALTDAWTSYTPTWTAASVNPSLGNGNIDGFYQAIGKTIIAAGKITMGSTTTYGTGAWLISLPVAAKTATRQLLYPGGAYLFDNSTTGNRQGGTALLFDTTKLFISTATGSVASAVPFTWATSDTVDWCIQYEAA